MKIKLPFLPCNGIVEENNNGEIEVSAVDPIASMQTAKNKDLEGIAKEVQHKFKKL